MVVILIFIIPQFPLYLGLDVQVKNEFGPSLGMKKSSSLESLQTMVQEVSTVCEEQVLKCKLVMKGLFTRGSQ
jgi:hypothetical protein